MCSLHHRCPQCDWKDIEKKLPGCAYIPVRTILSVSPRRRMWYAAAPLCKSMVCMGMPLPGQIMLTCACGMPFRAGRPTSEACNQPALLVTTTMTVSKPWTNPQTQKNPDLC